MFSFSLSVLDFGLVSGMDTSAIDNVNEILEICKANKCKLFLAGLSPGLRSDMAYAGIKKQAGSSLLTFMTDLETALARAEDGLLSTVFHLEEKTEAETSTRGHRRRESQVEDGFAYALKKIDEQHNLNTVIDLLDFRDYTSPIELEAGEILYRDMEDQSGLYFVETGLMRVRHPAGHSTLNTMSLGPLDSDVPTSNLYDPTQSLGHMNARGGTIGRQVAIWKEEYGRYEQNEQTFRLARIGQGWIIGGIETASGFKSPGLYVAISKTRLHHLPQSAIREVERTNPKLAMNLYKTLSHLSTKRQEVTIRQLGQFIRIINTPPPRLRGGRSDLARLHYA